MRFLHLGDLHIGKSVNEFNMIEDQKYILDQMLDIIEEKAIDGVLIAGDVYDRSIPSEEAVRLFDRFLNKLAELKKYVFIISGNHDSDERLNFGSRLMRKSQIYIAGRYDGQVEKVDVMDEEGPLHIWMMPFVKASRVAHFYPDADTSSYDAAIRTVVGKCEINKDERNIILVHQFVTGSHGDPELAGSEIASVSVGTVEKVGADCFDDFDYVAMGHIHSCQQVGRETCRYSGSPLKYSLNIHEINSEKTVPVVTMGEKGKVDVELIPLKPRREVRHLKGTLKQLIEAASDRDDYIYATLTDEDMQFDAMARLREAYPNTMKLDYDNTASRAIQEAEADIETEGKSFQELIGDFYQMINGREPSEKEWEILTEVAKEAEVIE